MTVNVDDVVAAYMKLRKAKDDLEKSIEEQVKAIETKMTKMESWIKEQADAQGVTSFKTKHGTAFLSTTDYATVADWDSVLAFIQQNGSFEMLNKAVNKVAVREYIQANKVVPPGVNYGTKIGVNIRKPTAKAED